MLTKQGVPHPGNGNKNYTMRRSRWRKNSHLFILCTKCGSPIGPLF